MKNSSLIHIMHDHKCSQCKAFYLPYEKGVVCPNCGFHEEDVYDIVPKLTQIAKLQIDKIGLYTPIVWWKGSFVDNVALLIFQALDAFEEDGGEDFKQFVQEYFDNKKWGNQLYMKNHVKDLAYRVYLSINNYKYND